MSETIRQSELRNNNAEIMRRVDDGESFTVTVHGRPVADLVPHQRQGRRRFVPAAEFEAKIAQLPPIDGDQWLRDVREVDSVFGDDLPADPWEASARSRDERG
ncbi:MAG: type II toxin-antitoxin system prevent-host-death family antitoxin [Pseudonocardiaceae bacterium]|nr:type II toxin-antitoxin system prevent-host-death family antitoxin [Pseudonocardiaceae bacterium]